MSDRSVCAPLPEQKEFGKFLSKEIESGNAEISKLLLKEANESRALKGGCGPAFGVAAGMSDNAKKKVKIVPDGKGEHLEFTGPF